MRMILCSFKKYSESVLNCLQDFLNKGELSEDEEKELRDFLEKLNDFKSSSLSCRQRIVKDLEQNFNFNFSEIQGLVSLLLNRTINLDEMERLKNFLECFLKEVESLPYVC